MLLLLRQNYPCDDRQGKRGEGATTGGGGNGPYWRGVARDTGEYASGAAAAAAATSAYPCKYFNGVT